MWVSKVMGNFFADQYDLFRTVTMDPKKSMLLLSRAVGVATGQDNSSSVKPEIKDACNAIMGHEKFDVAFDEVNRFFELLDNEIGVGET